MTGKSLLVQERHNAGKCDALQPHRFPCSTQKVIVEGAQVLVRSGGAGRAQCKTLFPFFRGASLGQVSMLQAAETWLMPLAGVKARTCTRHCAMSMAAHVFELPCIAGGPACAVNRTSASVRLHNDVKQCRQSLEINLAAGLQGDLIAPPQH